MYNYKTTKKPMRRKAVRAGEEVVVDVAPEATDLLFEAEDVAELVAEVTGEEVAVEADEDAVVFTVGEEEFIVEPDGDEEVLEASTKIRKPARKVSASTRRPAARKVSASTRTSARKVVAPRKRVR